MSEMPEIGSKISLISKADIRYEGNLFTVNPNECTIALANVRSYGTEDREVENAVPAHSGTYEFILFRGSDIKDIRVVNNQMPMNDPAIVELTMKPPSYHHQQHHQDSYNPLMGGGGPSMTSSQFPGGGGLYNPMASMAPGMGRTIMKPQQTQQQQQQRAILDLISGGGSRSSTPGLLGGSRKSPTIDQGIQVSHGSHKGVSFGGSQIKDDGKRINNRDGNRNRGGGGGSSGAIGDHTYNKSRGGGRGGGNNAGGGGVGGFGGDNKQDYRTQRRNPLAINHIRPGLQELGGGGMRQQNNQGGQQHHQQQQQQQQQRGWGGNRNGGGGGYNQGGGGYNQGGGGYNQGGGGGFNNGGGANQQANRQRGRGGRPQQGANFNRAPGQQLQPSNNSQKNKLKFEGDYDFDKANNEFEELRSQIAKVKIGETEPTAAAGVGVGVVGTGAKVNGESEMAAGQTKKDDSGNETGGGVEGSASTGQDNDEEEPAPIYYDKAKSFFDNISCEAVERSKGRSQRTDWRTERKLNSETFGVASARRGNFRGRGGYYGGGRGGNQGGGGYHRGGGGSYQHRMNFNQNWQRNSYNNHRAHHNMQAAVAAGSGDAA